MLAAGLSTASVGSVAADERSAESVARSRPGLIGPGQTVVFQGDSITDSGCKRDNLAANSQPAIGNGYAWLAAAQLLLDRPQDKLIVFNRGINGNQVTDLANRWQSDCLDLRPDVLSILIGVNDYAAHRGTQAQDLTLKNYELHYRALVERTLSVLPKVKLVICEPFALKVGAVDETWFPEYDDYRAAAKRVAESVGANFAQFQAMFDQAVALAPSAHWSPDGGHPSVYGAALMAQCWLNEVVA